MLCDMSGVESSDRQSLIEVRLSGPGRLEGLVRGRRAAGDSWRSIARQVHELTGVTVSHEALRRWYPETTTENVIPTS